MAKQPRKAGRGRPKLANAMSVRILCRVEPETKRALDAYAKGMSVAGAATALRMLAVQKLKEMGMMK